MGSGEQGNGLVDEGGRRKDGEVSDYKFGSRSLLGLDFSEL